LETSFCSGQKFAELFYDQLAEQHQKRQAIERMVQLAPQTVAEQAAFQDLYRTA